MDKLELKVLPILVVIILGGLVTLVAQFLPIYDYHFQAKIGWCIALVLIGVVIVLLGAASFRQAKTTVDPRNPNKAEHLVTAGLYQFTRNPMYLGFLLILAGWVVVLANYLAWLALPAFIFYINRFQIKPEERFMLAKFGDEYQSYKDRVRRWI